MMQDNFTYIVITLCVLLAVYLVWQEASRANKRWLVWRIAAVVLTCAMLACIALPISYYKSAQASSTKEFILLTDGFNADSVKSKASGQVFAITNDIKQAYPRATLLNSIDQLTDTLKGRPLHIYGSGLSPHQLAQLGDIAVVFHPNKSPAGVISMSWSEHLKAGEVLHVQGRYHNTSAQKVKLLLSGLNTVLDTMTIKQRGIIDFDLSAIPKSTGKMVYSLQSVTDGDTILQGSIPVQVTAVKPLKVLVLSASPDFESRFLKNWLSRQGYAVASRSAISKDKFSSDFINMTQLPLKRLSAATLNKFDVVMGDLSTLNALSGSESGVLKQQVEDKGLGLIVRADSTGKTSWLQKGFPVEKRAGKELLSSLIIDGNKTASGKLNVGDTFIRYQNGTQPLATDGQGHILAGSSIAGLGKLIFTTTDKTYTWVLGGNQADYSTLWSALLSKAARRDTSVQNSIQITGLPVAGEPAQIKLTGNNKFAIILNDETVAAEQNPALPFEQKLDLFAENAGWQTVSQNGKTEWFYVHNKEDWKGVQATARTVSTIAYAGQHKPDGIVTKQIQQKLRIEVPKIYFYILLLAALTFLWVERKLL